MIHAWGHESFYLTEILKTLSTGCLLKKTCGQRPQAFWG
jgi:hypothetical protein